MNIQKIREQYPQYEDMSDSDLAVAIHHKHFPDMDPDEFAGKFMDTGVGEISRPTHDNLEDAAVTATDSMEIPPEVKPVVKGTQREIMQMKRDGLIAQGKTLYSVGKDATYIIDVNAVQGIYGGTKAEAVREAKKDLRKGGGAESLLLGYPNREGLEPGETTDAAVTKEGETVTDLGQMKQEAASGNVAWAAEGLPDEVMRKAQEVAQAIKNRMAGKGDTDEN